MRQHVSRHVRAELRQGALLFVPAAVVVAEGEDAPCRLHWQTPRQLGPCEVRYAAEHQLALLEVRPGLFQLGEEGRVREHEPLAGQAAPGVRARRQHVDLRAPKPPRPLERVWARGRAAAVPQQMAVLGNAATREGPLARPRREEEGLEERVLLWVLCPGRALEAVDGGDVHPRQLDLLHVPLRHDVVVVEDEESRPRSFRPARLQDSPDVHPVDVERHGLQARAPVGEVVGRVRAGGAHLHVLGLRTVSLLITSRGLSRRLRGTAGPSCGVLLLILGDWDLDADCLHWQLLTLLHLVRTFVVQQALALLAGPLQLSREEPHIVVRLEAVAACEDVQRHLRRGEPEAAVRHRG